MDALEILVELKRLLESIQADYRPTRDNLLVDLRLCSIQRPAEYQAAIDAIDWEIDWLSQENIEGNQNG